MPAVCVRFTKDEMVALRTMRDRRGYASMSELVREAVGMPRAAEGTESLAIEGIEIASGKDALQVLYAMRTELDDCRRMLTRLMPKDARASQDSIPGEVDIFPPSGEPRPRGRKSRRPAEIAAAMPEGFSLPTAPS